MIVGLLVDYTGAPAVVAISPLLYPVLRRHSEVMALGYVGFRVLEMGILSASMDPVSNICSYSGNLRARRIECPHGPSSPGRRVIAPGKAADDRSETETPDHIERKVGAGVDPTGGCHSGHADRKDSWASGSCCGEGQSECDRGVTGWIPETRLGFSSNDHAGEQIGWPSALDQRLAHLAGQPCGRSCHRHHATLPSASLRRRQRRHHGYGAE